MVRGDWIVAAAPQPRPWMWLEEEATLLRRDLIGRPSIRRFVVHLSCCRRHLALSTRGRGTAFSTNERRAGERISHCADRQTDGQTRVEELYSDGGRCCFVRTQQKSMRKIRGGVLLFVGMTQQMSEVLNKPPPTDAEQRL